MKIIAYQILTVIVCILAIMYIPKGITVKYFIVLFCVMSIYFLVNNLYIFFFVPNRVRFKKLVNHIEHRLWEDNEWDGSEFMLNDFKKEFQTRNHENLKLEIKNKELGII